MQIAVPSKAVYYSNNTRQRPNKECEEKVLIVSETNASTLEEKTGTERGWNIYTFLI